MRLSNGREKWWLLRQPRLGALEAEQVQGLARRWWQLGRGTTSGLVCGQAHSICRAGDALGTWCTSQHGQWAGVAWGASQGGLSEVEPIGAQSCRDAHGGVWLMSSCTYLLHRVSTFKCPPQPPPFMMMGRQCCAIDLKITLSRG
jgi:hypothetical protein